jgi:hypothetical protein
MVRELMVVGSGLFFANTVATFRPCCPVNDLDDSMTKLVLLLLSSQSMSKEATAGNVTGLSQLRQVAPYGLHISDSLSIHGLEPLRNVVHHSPSDVA